MKCPIDNTDLAIADRQGIEIDYCPQCRGVWLDRGELDKLIERSGQAHGPARDFSDDDDDHEDGPRRHDERRHDSPKHHDDYSHQKKHKKEGFLGNLFDF